MAELLPWSQPATVVTVVDSVWSAPATVDTAFLVPVWFGKTGSGWVALEMQTID